MVHHGRVQRDQRGDRDQAQDTPVDQEADGDESDFEADSDENGRSPHDVQRVTWAELFFDLVFVFAVTQIAHAVSIGAGWPDLGRALLLFVPFWWTWVGASILFNKMEISATRRHLLLFAVGGAAFIMCIAAPEAYSHRGVMIGLAYLAARIVLGLAMNARGLFRASINPFSVGLFVGGPLWLVGGIAPDPARQWIWLAAAVIELATPIVLGHRLDYMTFDVAHLPERFGLFIIIALGEALVGIGQQGSRDRLPALAFAALILAFLLSCGLWWTYFQYGASTVEHALRTARVQAVLVRSVFSYGHLAFVVAIILMTGGMNQAVADPHVHPHGYHSLALGLGTSLYVGTFCFTRVKMYGGATIQRIAASAVAAVIAAFGPWLPAFASLAMLTALMLVLNAFEFWWVSSERPLLLIRMGTGAVGP
jgi:low temperature requirement protein LtrA